MNKMWHINSMKYNLAMNRSDSLISATTWTNFENIVLSEKASYKEHIFYDSLCMKCSD